MLISPIHIRTLVETLDLAGFETHSLTQACCPDVSWPIDEASPWVPLTAFDHMMELVPTLVKDEGFGLIAGTSIALARYGPCASLVMFAPTLRAALTDVLRFYPLLQPVCEMALKETGKKAIFLIKPLGFSDRALRFRSEVLMLGFLQMLRYMGAKDQDIDAPCFNYSPPDYAPRYLNMMGPHVNFDQPECALSFNADLLDRLQPCRDMDLYRLYKARAEVALASEISDGGLMRQLRTFLLENLAVQPQADEVARALKLTPRTMRRHLTVAGQTFSDVLGDCQKMAVTQMLAAGTHSIQQMAAATGFASSSSFHRAFKRWTGTTPKLWQQALRVSDTGTHG